MDTILPLQNKKHLSRRNGVYESFSSLHKSRKSFILTIHWNLANLVKTYDGIVLQHTIDPRHMVLRKERYAEYRKGTSAVLLQSGSDEKWWADSMECSCHLRNVQDIRADRKTPDDRRFGEPFKGTVVAFGAMVEYHPISAHYQSGLHQFGEKIPEILIGYAFYAVGM